MKKNLILFAFMVSVLMCGCGKKEDSIIESSTTQESSISESSESFPIESSEDELEGSSLTPVDSSEEIVIPTSESSEEVIESSSETEESSEEIVIPTSESSEDVIESSSEEVIESSSEIEESLEPQVKGAEEKDNLKDTYSEIDLSGIETDISFEDYSWFILSDSASPYDYGTYQIIICAINEYYGGDVPDEYTCDIATDIITVETNMIFSIKVTGKSSSLLLGLNLYENTASVEVLE